MCGIAGKIYAQRGRQVEPALINRMKQCMFHRGPDETGTYLRGPAGLGFQRLAIIDLASGQQPMMNEDGSVVIVFNGEIYNFEELRAELLANGHQFRTHSDTETIIHGYEQWGTAVASRLRGMFAFTIYDQNHHTVFMARDRTGKKPLYYCHHKEGTAEEALLFASEMKSILAESTLERRVDHTALSHYLTYQYVPHPWSIFEGVHKLPPAHWLLYKDGRITVERYWRLEYLPKVSISEVDAIEQTIEQLDEATRIRLISEVPLGCFLSGGIDSSMVVAMMRRHISGTLRTFSIGFREQKFSELPYARQVADLFSTSHEEFVVEPDAIGCLGELAWHFDEPFADSSALPTYHLSRMTRQHVTVALNGDGGDESFAGYERYAGVASLNRFNNLPHWLRTALRVPVAAGAPLNHSLRRLQHINNVSLTGPDRAYIEYMVQFREFEKQELLTPGFLASLPEDALHSEVLTLRVMRGRSQAPLVDRKMAGDIAMYLPGALLPKVDRTTMAQSLEGRSPFLDHKLMEFAARLPADLKFKNGRLKHLLKEAALKYFPAEFLNRQKQGFGVPLGSWLRGELRPLMEDYLLGERCRNRGYFNPDYVQNLVQQHLGGRDQHYRLWSLLMFEVWAHTFIDRADPLSGPIDVSR